MSNIDQTIEFLRENPTNFIRLTDLNTDKPIAGKDILLTDIPNQDLKAFVKGLVGSDDEVWVEHRVLKGVTNVKSPKVKSYKIAFQTRNPEPPQNVNPMQNQNPYQNPYQAPPMPHLAAPSFDVLSSPVVMQVRKLDEDRYNDLKDKVGDLKEELKDIKGENRIYEVENRELKTKLSVAEKEKEMAILSEKLNNKSFYDSPAFAKLLETAPQMIQGAIAMKTGAMDGTMGLAAPKLSEIKQDFIGFVTDSLTDNEVEYLIPVLHNLKNEIFINQLNQLISNVSSN